MKSTRARKAIEEQKRRLELQIAHADRVLDDAPPPIKESLKRILIKLGLRDKVQQYLTGKSAPQEQINEPLNSDERRLYVSWYTMITAQADDKAWKEFLESLLSPPKGRPQKEDPAMAAAVEERLNGSKLSNGQLARKHRKISRRSLFGKNVLKRTSEPHVCDGGNKAAYFFPFF
jgi:hypothetical protein